MSDPTDDGVSPEVLRKARAVYNETVIKHWLRPHNPGELPRPDGHGRVGTDCRDAVEIFLRIRQDRILEARFHAQGCVATLACASAAASLAEGCTVQKARVLTAEDVLEALGGLPAANEHCAQLAVTALWEALKDYLLGMNEPWKRLYR